MKIEMLVCITALMVLVVFQIMANLEVYREVKREGLTWKEYLTLSQPFGLGRAAMTSYYWMAAVALH